MHFFFGAVLAVVSALLSLKGTIEVFWYPQCLVASDRAAGQRLSRFGVLEGWHDGVGTAASNGVMAFP